MKKDDELKSRKVELRKLPEVEDKTPLPQELQNISDEVYPPWESLAPEKRAELVRAYCEDMAQNAAKKIQEKTYEGDVELSFCICDLGRYGKPEQYRKLVESFLDYPGQAFVATDALSVLCYDWDLTKEYIPTLKKFIIGVDCFGIEEIRCSAFPKAGHFLKENHHRDLLKFLLDVFENFEAPAHFKYADEESKWMTRAGAYEAIVIAMGKDYNNMHTNYLLAKKMERGEMDLINRSIINEAHQRLLTE